MTEKRLIEFEQLNKFMEGIQDHIMIGAWNSLAVGQEWIPTNIRLPESDGYYLLTAYNPTTSERWVSADWFYADTKDKCAEWDEHENEIVIAWMPMPEHFKE